MTQKYPSALLENAVNELASLPGVGRKTALRLALYMLRRDEGYTENFASALLALRKEVKYCKVCHNICDDEMCSICADPKRDQSTVCVVENIKEVMAIENTGQFRGVYHVLGGIISPIDGIGPGDLQIDSLVQRVANEEVKEIVLALSTTMEGDTTNFFIYRKLSPYNVKITVIARGVSIGDEIEYADEITLGRSIVNRTSFNDSIKYNLILMYETKISVIIVNYNVKYFLEQCLYSVQAAVAGLDAEVFVVDNNSTDGSVDYLRPRFPEVTFIENKDNPGFAKANNQAIRPCNGEYVLLLNPDTVIGEESLRTLCFFMDEHPNAGGIGVKMLDGHGVFLPESKRSFPSPWVSFCKIFGLSKLFPKSRVFQDIAWRIWIRRNNIKWMCWPVHLCCCAMKRWIRPDSWMKISLCMARTSTCRTGWCWGAIKTIISPSVFSIIKEKVPSMAI